MRQARMKQFLRRSAILCAVGLLGGSTVCFGSDALCASAHFTIAAGESQPGGNPFGKRFLQTFEVSTDLSPTEQSKKDHLDLVNVTLEVMIVRTWANATDKKDEEETIQLRVKRVRFGHFETRIKQDFDQLTVGIKRVYTRSITCDRSYY
jgi:hypothetical protein